MSNTRLANWDERLPNDIIYELNSLAKKSEILAQLAHRGFVQSLDELIEQVQQSETEQEKKAAEKALKEFLKEKAKQDQKKQDQKKQDQKKQDQAKQDQAKQDQAKQDQKKQDQAKKKDDSTPEDAETDGSHTDQEDGDTDDGETDGDDTDGGDTDGGDTDDGETDGETDGGDTDGGDTDGGDTDDGETDGETDGGDTDGGDTDGGDTDGGDTDDGDTDGGDTDGGEDDGETDGGDTQNKPKSSQKQSQQSKADQGNQNDFDPSMPSDIDLDAAIEMMQDLLDQLNQNQQRPESQPQTELSPFQKNMLAMAMRQNPETQEILEKMALLQNLDKNDTITNLPENFKKLLWNIPKMLGVFKDVTDGFKRGRPSATFGEKIVQTRGKLVRPRVSKIAQDFELYPSLALLDIAKNNTHVYRSQEKSGEGEFVLAVDLSGSMNSFFDNQGTFTFFDLAKTIAICLYSIKKTHIVGWGDQSVVFSSQEQFAQAGATQSNTLIGSCYYAINQLFENKKIANKLQKGTDVVILTDGLPHDRDGSMAMAIKQLVAENKGIVWLFDLIGENKSYRDNEIPTQWDALVDRYVRIQSLDDIKNIESTMRKSMRKIK